MYLDIQKLKAASNFVAEPDDIKRLNLTGVHLNFSKNRFEATDGSALIVIENAIKYEDDEVEQFGKYIIRNNDVAQILQRHKKEQFAPIEINVETDEEESSLKIGDCLYYPFGVIYPNIEALPYFNHHTETPTTHRQSLPLSFYYLKKWEKAMRTMGCKLPYWQQTHYAHDEKILVAISKFKEMTLFVMSMKLGD